MIVQIKAYLNRISMRTQLLCLAILIILTIVTVLTAYNYKRSINLSIKQIFDANQALLSLESQSFAAYLSDLDNFSLSLRNDSTFIQAVTTLSPMDYATANYIQGLMKSSFYSRKDLLAYEHSILNQKQTYAISNSSKQLKIRNVPDSKQIDMILQNTSAPNYLFITPSENPAVLMVYYREIIDIKTQKPLALVKLTLNTQYIRSITAIHDKLNNCFVLLDPAGNCFYTNQPEVLANLDGARLVDSLYNSNQQYYDDADNTTYLIVGEQTGNFYFVTLTPLQSIMESLTITRNISFALGLIAILITMALFAYFIQLITKPLSILAKHMKEAGKGDFSTRWELHGSSEIQQLTQRYNAMLTEIDDLIKKNYIAKYNEEQAKLIALESQVEPHFINNTLQTIATEAIVNNQHKIYDMVLALSSLQRYALKGQEMISVETEMDEVHKFILLQKARMDTTLSYSEEIEETAYEKLLPKLSIMTLVENSIQHGIAGDRNSIAIYVHIDSEPGFLLVKVTDDGAGITPEKIDEIQAVMKSHLFNSINTQNIGLLNLNSRLKILFGEHASLDVESEIGAGTTVTLRVPDEKGVMNVQNIDH